MDKKEELRLEIDGLENMDGVGGLSEKGLELLEQKKREYKEKKTLGEKVHTFEGKQDYFLTVSDTKQSLKEYFDSSGVIELPKDKNTFTIADVEKCFYAWRRREEQSAKEIFGERLVA